MRKIVRNGFAALLLTLLGSGLTTAGAEQRPVPWRLFEAQGTLRFVDLATGQIMIDDRSYRLTPKTAWYGVDVDKSLQSQLLSAAGREVGFAIDSKAKRPTLRAVLLLPPEDR